jgi:hypothetical protein|nr:MAG TPA: hypothetical protein [Caudoviricetes sp.]
MKDLLDKLNNLIKFEQIEIKSAYDNYYPYDKVILVEDLIDILDAYEQEEE